MSENRFDDGDLEALAAELRQRVGREFRWEAEDVEHLTDQQRRRNSSLTDIAYEAMSRGDSVILSRAETRHRGVLVSVHDDLAVLETGAGLVNAQLSGVIVTIAERRPTGGTTGGGARSFRGRIAELEQSGEQVIVEGADLELKGRITVAAADHVAITDTERREWFVPYGEIWFVVQPRD